MSVYTYDPSKYTIIVGPSIIGGFADGTFIKASRSDDAFKKVVGIGGIVSRLKSTNKSGEIEIDLVQTSPSNDVLSALANLDEQTNGGVVPVFIKDGNGRSVAASAYAWVRKMPDLENGKEMGNRKWILDTADLDFFIGGSDAA